MDQELRKLKKLTAFMKKEGVLAYKTSEIELHLSPEALLSKKAPLVPDSGEELKPVEQNELEKSLGLPAGGAQALFWSTPGLFPEEAEQ